MVDKIRKEKFITPIGVSFVEFIVTSFMPKAIEPYKKRDFTKRNFQ